MGYYVTKLTFNYIYFQILIIYFIVISFYLIFNLKSLILSLYKVIHCVKVPGRLNIFLLLQMELQTLNFVTDTGHQSLF